MASLLCGSPTENEGSNERPNERPSRQSDTRTRASRQGSDRSFSARLSSGQTVAWGGFECSTRTQERFGRRMARCELCREGEHKVDSFLWFLNPEYMFFSRCLSKFMLAMMHSVYTAAERLPSLCALQPDPSKRDYLTAQWGTCE